MLSVWVRPATTTTLRGLTWTTLPFREPSPLAVTALIIADPATGPACSPLDFVGAGWDKLGMRATVCLIHGNWHDGSSWSPLVMRLQGRGYEVVAPDLPFDDPVATYQQRAQPALDAVARTANPVVIVGHSVGSAEAALVASQRPTALLVYLCPRFGSFPVPADAPSVFRDGFPFPSKDAEGRLAWQPNDAIKAMYPRLPHETATELASRLRPGAFAVGDYPLTTHPTCPTALIYTSDDEFFNPDWERYVAHHMLGIEPVELAGGHFPMQEDPDTLAEVLDRLINDSLASDLPAQDR
jgi:pimeloyl-ACP methyl ester carboxylesterase